VLLIILVLCVVFFDLFVLTLRLVCSNLGDVSSFFSKVCLKKRAVGGWVMVFSATFNNISFHAKTVHSNKTY